MADDLYALPLEEFTAARNALARELSRAGDKEEAARVKGLRKPSQPAWIVNQLVRRHPRDAKALLVAGDELRAAQEKALGGAGRGDLDTAVAAEREAVDRLLEAARNVAAEGGVTASTANLERVRATLHAVSLDPDARNHLEAGDFVEDHAATGMDALALMAPAVGRSKRGGRKTKSGDAGAARKRLRKAEAEEQRVEEELGEAQRELNSARERVKQLEGRLKRARAAVEKARAG